MSLKSTTRRAKPPIFRVGGDDQEFLSSKEAAEFLKIKMSHLYNLTSKKALKFYQPHGKLMYFFKLDLIEWILNNQNKHVNQLNQLKDETK